MSISVCRNGCGTDLDEALALWRWKLVNVEYLEYIQSKNSYTLKTQKLKYANVNSLCQGALQYVGCVCIRQTSCFIQWIELNKMVPQHTNQLLGFGVQTHPEKQRHITT